MQRFATRETKYESKRRSNYLSYMIAPIVLLIFYLLINTVSSTTVSKQEESLRRAINRDIIHCYALEGYYPPSLDYLEEHYALTYNKDLFIIDYHPLGANIKPEYTILNNNLEK